MPARGDVLRGAAGLLAGLACLQLAPPAHGRAPAARLRSKLAAPAAAVIHQPQPSAAATALSAAAAVARAAPSLPSHAAAAVEAPAPDELAELQRSLLSGTQLGTRLRAQTGVVHRSLRFTQDVYDRLRKLETNLYVVRADASVFPPFEATALAGRVGLVGGFEAAYAGSVHDADFGHEYPAVYTEFHGGLRGRYPLRQHLLGFELTLDWLHAGLNDPRRLAATPEVSYTDVRSSLDFTLGADRLRATAAAGFRVPLAYGEIGEREWFPRVGGYAIESSLAASYLVKRGISVEFSLSLRRFVLEMNSRPEDGQGGVSEVAGGAVDSLIGAYLGVGFVL